MHSNFFQNSQALDCDALSTPFWVLVYSQMIISLGVILHSIQINWDSWKDRGWHYVRATTEIAAFTGIFTGFMTIFSCKFPSPVTKGILYDVLGAGGCGAIVQLCDNLIVLERSKAIANMPTYQDVFFKLYIFIVMYLPWWPIMWLIPFFYNVNEPIVLYWMGIGNRICCSGNIVYNAYFTASFSHTLLKIHGKSASTNNLANKKIQAIAIKSIFHCFLSCFGNIWADFVGLPDIPSGWVIYSLTIIVGLHFVFNFKIENVLFGIRKGARRMIVAAASKYHTSENDKSQSKSTRLTFFWKNFRKKQLVVPVVDERISSVV